MDGYVGSSRHGDRLTDCMGPDVQGVEQVSVKYNTENSKTHSD
jgi:hypothetical protein